MTTYRTYACKDGDHEQCCDKDCECSCHAEIEAEPWRQGYVGTFPELCGAYGRACSAISAFEDDASIPLDEHIAMLVKRLAVAEAALETRGEAAEHE